MWTPEGKNRYTWAYPAEGAGVPDPARPRRLIDPGDGSLIEADGPTVLRYPAATLSDDGLIINETGECLVVQNTGWNPVAEDFWERLEFAALADDPVWEEARHLVQPIRTRPRKADPVPVTPSVSSE